jgi:hypothetical protein
VLDPEPKPRAPKQMWVKPQGGAAMLQKRNITKIKQTQITSKTESNLGQQNRKSIVIITVILALLMAFENMSFSCINCNSLNVSASGKFNQALKIYGITKLRTDVIILSDIQICGKNRVSYSNELQKMFLCNPYGSYEFFYNSTMNKRGVWILIKKSNNFSVHRRKDDPGENYLLLEVTLEGKKMVIGSIYGPNTHDQIFFYKFSS